MQKLTLRAYVNSEDETRPDATERGHSLPRSASAARSSVAPSSREQKRRKLRQGRLVDA
jgi:hypothetical protein